MARAFDRIALIQIIRLHPSHQQAVHQRLHYRGIVVDAFEQHGLRTQRNACVGQARGRFGNLRRQLFGVREMDAHPQGVMFPQHLHQILGDALRKHGRYLAADAQELDVPNRPQAAQQIIELVVADGERIAAREQHVADLAMLFEVIERELPIAHVELIFAARIADQPRARAIAAIGRAGSGGEEQHAVGIAMHQARHHRVVVLS